MSFKFPLLIGNSMCFNQFRNSSMQLVLQKCHKVDEKPTIC
uniref:Uncharacterized protein n=1 Tax=Arundo donax TaxID=35708 RepID=A0A0A9EG56_ARUDO